MNKVYSSTCTPSRSGRVVYSAVLAACGMDGHGFEPQTTGNACRHVWIHGSKRLGCHVDIYTLAISVGFSQKLNIVKLLFSFPSEILSLKPVFGACSYADSNSGSLNTYKQTQRKVHLDLIVALQCLLVCM